MEVAVLIGIQGSGKSSFAHSHLGETHVRISRDVLRTAQRERLLHYACFSANQSFVADNTHPDPQSRAPLLAAARATGFRAVAYFFPVELEECLRRNAARSGRSRVPDVALHTTVRRMVAPTRMEGFERIFEVRLGPEGYTVVEMSDEG